MLEPYDGKLSHTVLRGEEGRKPLALPGTRNFSEIFIDQLTEMSYNVIHENEYTYNQA